MPWKEVFKVGTQTDASGNQHNWTVEELDNIVQLYNNQPEADRHEAPVCVGHPVTSSPAYGWVKQLKRQGDTLYADFIQMDPQFEELVNAGRYKKVSIALNENNLLRHVGYLGAIPPAVKGLKDINFNEKEVLKIYSIDNLSTKQGNPQMDPTMQIIFLNWLGDTFTPEIRAQAEAKLKELESAKQQAKQNKNPLPNQPTANPQPAPNPAGTPAGNSESNGQPAYNEPKKVETPKFNETAEYKELQTKMAKLEKENSDMQFNEYFNKLLHAGKVTPVQKEIIKQTYDSVPSSVEFSEGSEKKNITGKELVQKLIDSFPKQVEFSEFADGRNIATQEMEETKIFEEYNKSKGFK